MPKLDLLKSSESTSVIISAIREITGDTNHAYFTGTVSAKINGRSRITSEKITVHLTNSRPNFATIDIMWEDCGYKNYREMGLYGRMTTQWYEASSISDRSISLFNESIEIEIYY
ncbi:hypothetical protein [Pseudomonas koreensis]|uniref:hypothetical protein n=1 Tax=Pseudomonas koreensis TaxID=198620 RepID=UPI0018E69947|nr:hypothetical protein [Pseudomonas koreensis]MBI6949456.1 hypothetical protein [Pseudomonas koreensis]